MRYIPTLHTAFFRYTRGVRDQLLVYLPVVSLTFLAALVLVAALTPQVERFAKRIGALQQGGGRRVHEGAVPNIGGVAIFGGLMGALLVGGLLRPALLAAYREELLAIALGGALMTLVGLFDDLWEVPALTRLACQFVAAGILVVNGVRVDFITNYFGGSPYQFFGPVLAALVTLVWIVGFTNAFNFIDGLDGLSSGLAAISSLALLAVAVQLPDRGAAVLLLAALAGSATGAAAGPGTAGAASGFEVPGTSPAVGAVSRGGLGYSVPVRLRISRLGIDTTLMTLGLNPDQTVQVPPGEKDAPAGWYHNLAAPGQNGPAVILGHVDATGGPAVFYPLGTSQAGDRIEVRSAGSQPADQVNPSAVAAMAEEGIDLSAEVPKVLTVDAVKASDVVVTMGCGDTCPIFPGKRYEDWILDDPAGQGVEAVRPIRDEIRRRVERLVSELTPDDSRT